MNEPNVQLPHLVVLGGGLAGLSVARECLRRGGCRVTVLEKAPQIGGSASYSGCTIWCAADLDAWLSVQPDGDPELVPH